MNKIFILDKKNIQLKDITLKFWIKVVSIILLSIGLTSVITISLIKTNHLLLLTPEEKLIIINSEKSFNEDKLIQTLKKLNIKFPYIVLAQSKLETANYNSTIFKVNNNLFGMKQAQLRITTSNGTELGHAHYNNWYESVIDYALYASRYLSDIDTEDEYYQFLKQNYAEDPKYIDSLKYLVERYNLKSKFKQ